MQINFLGVFGILSDVPIFLDFRFLWLLIPTMREMESYFFIGVPGVNHD